jgi:hypothetical protein
MPQKPIAQQIADAHAKRQQLDAKLATLKRENAKRQKAAREQRGRRIGRLAERAGLFAFTDAELATAFEHLKNALETNRHNGRNPRDGLQSDDKQETYHASSST